MNEFYLGSKVNMFEKFESIDNEIGYMQWLSNEISTDREREWAMKREKAQNGNT